MSRKKFFLSFFLEALGAKFTYTYLHRYYSEHPDYNSLHGISKVLGEYAIDSYGVEVDNKTEGILSLEPPFIAFLDNQFVTVTYASNSKVIYYGNTEFVLSLSQFISKWSGIALIAENKNPSPEPEYQKTKREERLIKGTKIAFATLVIVAICICIFHNSLYFGAREVWLLVINGIGSYVSYLLIEKQYALNSNRLDWACDTFKKTDCDAVLKSRAGKLFGIFGWSEIGLSYFLSNIIILVTQTSLVPFLSVVNILALPYTFWSIWYQKFKVKQWCPLCLIVQVLLWAIFAVNLFAGFTPLPAFSIYTTILVVFLYLTPFLIIRLLHPFVYAFGKTEVIQQELNSIKASDDIFRLLLKQQTQVPISKQDSQILFGNINAKNIITIFLNPYCGSCAALHSSIDKLFSRKRTNICVQYIFTSYAGVTEDDMLLLLFSIYFDDMPYADRFSVYTEWYDKGRYSPKAFKKKYGKPFENEKARQEYFSHQKWVERNRSELNATPTIFFNGYKIPKMYLINDVFNFFDLDINSK